MSNPEDETEFVPTHRLTFTNRKTKQQEIVEIIARDDEDKGQVYVKGPNGTPVLSMRFEYSSEGGLSIDGYPDSDPKTDMEWL